jgi:hypothetical protein
LNRLERMVIGLCAALCLCSGSLAGPATPLSVQSAAPGAAPGAAVRQAATVVMITGRGLALSADGSLRALVNGSPVFEGELVSTGPSTYLNLKFVDQSLFLLRPNTRFQIEEFSHAAPAAEPLAPARRTLTASVTPPRTDTAFFRLLKGGFRAVTGAVGKTERERFRVATPVATIGIRGTDFETRWCATDCDDAGLHEQDGLHGYSHAGTIVVTTGDAAPALGALLERAGTWLGYSAMTRLDLAPQALDPAVLPLVATVVNEVRFDAVSGTEIRENNGFSRQATVLSNAGTQFLTGSSSTDSVSSYFSAPTSPSSITTYSGRSNSLGSLLISPSSCVATDPR